MTTCAATGLLTRVGPKWRGERLRGPIEVWPSSSCSLRQEMPVSRRGRDARHDRPSHPGALGEKAVDCQRRGASRLARRPSHDHAMAGSQRPLSPWIAGITRRENRENTLRVYDDPRAMASDFAP